MKKNYLLLVMSCISLFAYAQKTVFYNSQVLFALQEDKNNCTIRHMIDIPYEGEEVINLLVVYADTNGVVIDSSKQFLRLTEDRVHNGYWHGIVEQNKPSKNYNCTIILEREDEGILLQTNKKINAVYPSKENYTTPPFAFVKDSTIHFPLQLIENFADTNVKSVMLQYQVLNAVQDNLPFYLYYRVTKKSKPSHILFSVIDTVMLSQKTPISITKEINLSQLESGQYNIGCYLYHKEALCNVNTIQIQLLSNYEYKNKVVASVSTETITTTVDISKSFVAKYDLTTLLKNLDALKPISTIVEIKNIDNFTDNKNLIEAQRFFYNFWEARSSTPEKAWEEYTIKLNECVKKYYGVKTDQARIYLRYGKPDKVEEVPNEQNTIPYEIWYYENLKSETSVSFLFIQANRTNANDKRLLHSTYSSELHNQSWQRILIQVPGDQYRVYEYIKPGQ
jgi:GWxTD domain-containing protein